MHISDCCQFSDIHISQGSVATYIRCGGIFKYGFVANLPVSLPLKEFWKSVNIWGSYRQEFSVLFFLRHSVEELSNYRPISNMSLISRIIERVVVWPTTSCFADWSKRRHVTLRIIDCQEVVLTFYRIFITCHPQPRDMSTHVTWSRVTCCKYSTKMKSLVRFPADH